MEWLNYHHLLYFHTVVREGSVVKAAEKLFLTQPTLSTQIKALEGALGESLFSRKGRKLELTEAGQVAFKYADEIFGLGQELRDTLKGRATAKMPEFRVGVTNVVPKAIAHALLAPVLSRFGDIRIVCRENEFEALLIEMAAHKLDLILSDAPVPEGLGVKAFSHPLGECDMTFMAAKRQAASMRKKFPGQLGEMPLLLPGKHSAMRRALDAWFERKGVRPKIRGEFEDSALLKVFGSEGHGLLVVPTWVAGDVRHTHGLEVVARVSELQIRFYAISPERRIKHPATQHLLESARRL